MIIEIVFYCFEAVCIIGILVAVWYLIDTWKESKKPLFSPETQRLFDENKKLSAALNKKLQKLREPPKVGK